MDFKEVTISWLKGLRVLGMLIAGIPTLGLTWVLAAEASSRSGYKKMGLVVACEDWLELWRKVTLFFLGFVTLGYAWAIMSKLDTVLLLSWRVRWKEEK